MPKIGLKNIHIAKLLTDTDAATTYELPKKFSGAVQADIKPSSSTENFYSDDQLSDSVSALSDIAVDLEMGDLTTEMQAFLLGAEIDTNGVIHHSTNDIAPYVALLYESAKSDGSIRYEALYKGKFALPESSAKTKGDKVDFQTEKISATFMARQSDGEWKVNVDSNDTGVGATVITNWYKGVYSKTPTV